MVCRWCWQRSLSASRGCAMSSPVGGYAGDKLRDALRRIGEWTAEIVKRSDSAKGFVVLPRHWVVERTLP